MKTFEIKTPDWIQFREYVVGDVIAEGGTINQEGVANRATKQIHQHLVGVSNVALGNDIQYIFNIGYSDKVGNGAEPCVSNSLYIVNLDGNLTLNLPKTPVIGDKIIVSRGEGLPSAGASILVQGVYSDTNPFGGYKIGNKDQLLVGNGVLDFSYSFVFNGNTWEAKSLVGSVASENLSPGSSESAEEDDYIVVQPGGGGTPYTLTLDQLGEFLYNIFPAAEEGKAGKIAIASLAETTAGKINTKAITPLRLRTELPRYMQNTYMPRKAIGDLHFVSSLDSGDSKPVYDSDKVVRTDFLFVSDSKDFALMVTKSPKSTVYSRLDNCKYSYNTSTKTWVKTGTTVESDVPKGRIYYNTYTRKQYFVVSGTNVIELTSDLNMDEIKAELDKRYIKQDFILNGHPMGSTGSLDLAAGDIVNMEQYIRNVVKNILNTPEGTTNENILKGSLRWTSNNTTLQCWNGSTWMNVYPAIWAR